MQEDIRHSRIQILLQQRKYTEAERILKDILTENSGNIRFLALLAEVYLQQNKPVEAKNVVDNAIALSPDTSHLFYIRSRIAVQEDQYDEAEKHIKQAIALDPYDADYFALLANIKLTRKQYQKALELADRALEIDSENLLGLNTRSSALLKLNRKEESFDTIEGALRDDPNNAYTHANYGWGLLEKGNHKKARVHFRESLKSDPTFEYAQSGMLEAIKAGNPIYRAFLKYAFWMSNLTAKYQWAVIIGFYLGTRALKAIARTNESLQPYLAPLIIVLTLIAFSTWIITPISNLFLRFNVYGQLLLSRKKKMSSNFVAAALAIFLVGIGMYVFLSDEKYLSIAVYGFAMMVPFSAMFSASKPKNLLLVYAIAMAVVGIIAINQTFLTGELFNLPSTIFIFGFVGFQWIANFLLIREDNR